MHIVYPEKKDFMQAMKEADNRSFDFVVMVTDILESHNADSLKEQMDECVRVLKDGGVLFVQGRPEYLPEIGVYLDQTLNFKYWIAIESQLQKKEKRLPSAHASVLLFTKGNGRFHVKRTRFPHQHCDFCERTLKDWGGKSHLMHPEGYVISDVWKDLPKEDNYTQLSKPVLEAVLRMLDFESSADEKPDAESTTYKENSFFQQLDIPVVCGDTRGLIGPKEGITSGGVMAESVAQYTLPGFPAQKKKEPIEVTKEIKTGSSITKLYNVVHHGDAVEILKQYPENSIDLVFADPPYNLDKEYIVYDDELADEEYLAWCNTWLQEYVRILKPTGSLYVLNLPRWTMYHAAFLNQRLYFQNWIVWDAMAMPLGKVMPAHYGLLLYTKHPTDFTFNYDKVNDLDARYYCLRRSCIRKRKEEGVDDKMPLTDIWWDIHRIKHKRDRDSHPCQLPDELMERIIQLSTNKGDVVLDALGGAGTTPVTSLKLDRQYVAIDIDEKYVEITKNKLDEIKNKGYVERESTHKPQQKYTKKELQLELRDLAQKLGRLPTPKDVQEMSEYNSDVFLTMFPSWNKALKAAKPEIQS
ncbi:MAG: Modification methylase BamHI [Chloroflexi bacterium]|nr:Modification methylase BamHI [Chloroflexota bacterium]